MEYFWWRKNEQCNFFFLKIGLWAYGFFSSRLKNVPLILAAHEYLNISICNKKAARDWNRSQTDLTVDFRNYLVLYYNCFFSVEFCSEICTDLVGNRGWPTLCTSKQLTSSLENLPLLGSPVCLLDLCCNGNSAAALLPAIWDAHHSQRILLSSWLQADIAFL